MDGRSGWYEVIAQNGKTCGVFCFKNGKVVNNISNLTADFFLERGYRFEPRMVLNLEAQYLSLDTLVKEIEEWQEKTFPNSTHDGVLDHLEEEVWELKKDPDDWKEIADVFILLVAAAKYAGISLANAARAKMMLNRERTWGKPDERGVINHVRENE